MVTDISRRHFLGVAAMGIAAAHFGIEGSAANLDAGIRPFRINIPDGTLADMRRRISATDWPERETVPDESQGVQLATIQKLARYWATDYDWRKCEAHLNALPNFITEIDGLEIHFIHVRSKHEKRCRSSSRTAGPARSSSRWALSIRLPTPQHTEGARRTRSIW
jgi:hypothetical protein